MAPTKAARGQKPLPLNPAQIPRQPVYQVWPPKVKSLQSLDLVMAELARVAALTQHEGAMLDIEVGRLTKESENRLTVEIGDQDPMPMADWIAALEEAAKEFCTEHRESLLDEGRKSRDLNHGRFGWRDSPAGLEPLGDFDDKGNQKLLTSLLADLRKALKNLADFADGGARFVDVKLSWRKKELLAAHLDQDLPLSVLKKTGFTICEETENFYITPGENAMQSQSAEKPEG